MDKYTYFVTAISRDMFRLTAWVISIFGTIVEEPDAYKADPYPFRLVRRKDGLYFVPPVADRTGDTELVRITDADPSNPLFSFGERCNAKAGALKNLKKDIDTTYGNLIFNAIVLAWPFGDKIDYMDGRVKIGALEALIIDKLVDDLEDGAEQDPDKIYVSELLNYYDAIYSLTAYTQLCVPSASEKSLTTNPEILVRRDQLLAENADRLHDPAVLAAIEKELTDMDREWIANSESAGFFIKDKNFDITRKKTYIMQGGQLNEVEGGGMSILPGALIDTWPLDKLDVVTNSLRSGVYNRGKDTALGGERVKYFFRIMQNARIAMDDCNTSITMPTRVNIFNANSLVGLYTQSPGLPPELITKARIKSLMGTIIPLRDPQFCKGERTDFCGVCMGAEISQNPNALGALSSDVGSRMMGAFMKAGHGKALAVAPFHLTEEIF